MNIHELQMELNKLGIDPMSYYLHGIGEQTNDSDKLAMAIRRGKYSVEYEIYFTERGEKNLIQLYDNEADACNYFLRSMKEKYFHKIIKAKWPQLKDKSIEDKLRISGLREEFEERLATGERSAMHILRYLIADEDEIKRLMKK